MDDAPPQKIRLIFFRCERGTEPVREWLKGIAGGGTSRHREGPFEGAMALADRNASLPADRRQTWEIRTDLPTKRTAASFCASTASIWWRCTASSRRRGQPR
jgi:hypothetical protein